MKSKEVMINVPCTLSLENENEAALTAAAFNTFIHGKVKMKYEILGLLGGQTIALFYMQRNNESQQLRDEFMQLIQNEEVSQ